MTDAASGDNKPDDKHVHLPIVGGEMDIDIGELIDDIELERPRTREECRGGPRPCGFLGCPFNLTLDVEHDGRISFNMVERPDKPARRVTTTERTPPEMIDALTDEAIDRWRERGLSNCLLDHVEERGEMTLREVGEVYGITHERCRQIEANAFRRAPKTTRDLLSLLNDEACEREGLEAARDYN